jgi:regulator of protease activity HflC (stomatin/prohibitin superfamily)
MIAAIVILLVCFLGAGLVLAGMSIRVLREYERGVVFRLGRVTPARGPGLIFLLPAIDRMVRVSLRTVTLKVPAQEVITRDNVPARVTAVTYYKVIDPTKSVLEIKVTMVEIKDVEIPDRMQHAIARQAEAERERRAKVINAEGEFQAAARLTDAADVITRNPVAIQLRYLQTLMEVSNNQSSTIVLPLPFDALQPLVGDAEARRALAAPERSPLKTILLPGQDGPKVRSR